MEWNWRRQRLTVFASVVRRPALRSGAHCQRLFGVVRRKLLGIGGPDGPGRASWYLQTVFFPQGREWSRPTKDFAERLVRHVDLQVVMRGHPAEGLRLEAPKIVCTGPLDAERATVGKPAVN